MSTEEIRPDSTVAVKAPSSPAFARLLSLQDIVMLAYLPIVWVLVWRSTPGPAQDWCARRVYWCIAVSLLACWAARGVSGLPYAVRWVVYRVSLVGVLLENYLMLRELLPLVRPDSIDEALYQLDLRLFGVEPALWLERLNHKPIVEYFAFFYFSYFFICVAYMVTVILIARGGAQTSEFATGTLMVFCLGQIGYMAVPAFGPVRHLAPLFHGDIQGGFFWGCVSATVQAGSAMKDVFPSLHTAVPTWFTFFALHRSKFDRRWRWPARVTGFFAANIIFSTMFLRWHYAIDIVAGVALAASAGLLAPRLQRWEAAWREAHGLMPVWSFER
jgi:membrane-associated phospholipid phosphatase